MNCLRKNCVTGIWCLIRISAGAREEVQAVAAAAFITFSAISWKLCALIAVTPCALSVRSHGRLSMRMLLVMRLHYGNLTTIRSIKLKRLPTTWRRMALTVHSVSTNSRLQRVVACTSSVIVVLTSSAAAARNRLNMATVAKSLPTVRGWDSIATIREIVSSTYVTCPLSRYADCCEITMLLSSEISRLRNMRLRHAS